MAKFALLIEADEKEEKMQDFMFYRLWAGSFITQFCKGVWSWRKEIKVVQEAGDILWLYECKLLELSIMGTSNWYLYLESS